MTRPPSIATPDACAAPGPAGRADAGSLVVSGEPIVAIGGVGGSGTRIVAQCLQELGHFMGSDLNEAHDNLWFTLLFKRAEILGTSPADFRVLVEIFLGAMRGSPVNSLGHAQLVKSLAARDRPVHPSAWLRARARSLLGVTAGPSPNRVGWKEPNTHIVLDRLALHLPGLRYIHVMRNGLDMAHSANQYQTRLWGPVLTGQPFRPGPAYSLHYWRKAHERVFAIGRELGDRFLLLNYDDFCSDTGPGIRRLGAFAGLAPGDDTVAALAARVRPPSSVGRHRDHGLDVFDPADVDFVASCGFAVR